MLPSSRPNAIDPSALNERHTMAHGFQRTKRHRCTRQDREGCEEGAEVEEEGAARACEKDKEDDEGEGGGCSWSDFFFLRELDLEEGVLAGVLEGEEGVVDLRLLLRAEDVTRPGMAALTNFTRELYGCGCVGVRVGGCMHEGTGAHIDCAVHTA
jgi:hypothetical protein